MIASIKIRYHSPGGYELQTTDSELLEIPAANYAIDDIIRHNGRRFTVTGREWEGGVVAMVFCQERRSTSDAGLDAKAGKKGRAA